jgi:hypothetical protein
MRLRFPIVLVLLAFAPVLSAQSAAASTALPKIHFTFDHPDLLVTHFDLDISADGHAHYESRIKGAEKGTMEEGVTRDFVVSPETTAHIFDLAKAANRLQGDFDFTKHRIAFTGNKTVTYTDEQGSNTAKFVWSENETVMKLSDLLQGISGTLEEEPILQRMRRYDPLGLNAELAKMEKLANSGYMRELNLISPILQELADDPNVMSPARKRAAHLLQKATQP